MANTRFGFRVVGRLGQLPSTFTQFGRWCAGQVVALCPLGRKRNSPDPMANALTVDAPRHLHPGAPAEPRRAEPTPLHSEAVDALIAQLRAASSWQVRASAALSLRDVKAEGVLPALARALRDRSVDVAAAAADALSYRREAAAERALLAVLENADETISPVIRLAVANALERLNLLRASVVEALSPRESDPPLQRSAGTMERGRASDLTELVQPSP